MQDGEYPVVERRIGRIYLSAVIAVALVLLLAAGGPALAQETQTPQTLGGGEIGYLDWLYHLPLALGCALLVVAVDAFVILRYIRGKEA